MYCLADGDADFNGIEVVHFLSMPESDGTKLAVPTVPAAQRAAMVFTSGSTGEPVAHPKSWGSLCKGAAAEAEALGHRAEFRNGHTGHRSGTAHVRFGIVHAAGDAERFGAGCRKAVLSGGHLCATGRIAAPALSDHHTGPFAHSAGRSSRCSACQLCVVCHGALLAPQLAIEAEARFGAPLYEIYGCTEAGHGSKSPHDAGSRLGIC
jgi:acyl-coenzyme A synthetase/AMP-(fatty) acid ligase